MQPMTPSSIIRTGDYYKIQFTPDKDGFVYIFQRDSSGQFYQIYPLGAEVKKLTAGTSYFTPAEDKAFELDDQIGEETFYLLGVSDRDKTLEGEYSNLESESQQLGMQSQQSRLQFADRLINSDCVSVTTFSFDHRP